MIEPYRGELEQFKPYWLEQMYAEWEEYEQYIEDDEEGEIMPQENFTITSQHVTTQFNLAWSEDYADMLLQVQADGDTTHRFLLEASSVTLREIANQFLEWSHMLEQVEHDAMDKAMAEMKAAKNG